MEPKASETLHDAILCKEDTQLDLFRDSSFLSKKGKSINIRYNISERLHSSRFCRPIQALKRSVKAKDTLSMSCPSPGQDFIPGTQKMFFREPIGS